MEFNFINYLLIVFFSIILSYFLTRLMIKISEKFNILDNPNSERKIHDRATPLLGGWAIYLGFLFILIFIILLFPRFLLGKDISNFQIFGILLSGLILMIAGTIDDKYNLSAKVQFIFKCS